MTILVFARQKTQISVTSCQFLISNMELSGKVVCNIFYCNSLVTVTSVFHCIVSLYPQPVVFDLATRGPINTFNVKTSPPNIILLLPPYTTTLPTLGTPAIHERATTRFWLKNLNKKSSKILISSIHESASV